MFRFPRIAPTRPIQTIGMGTTVIALTLALGVQVASVAEASAAKHASLLVSTMKNATLGAFLVNGKGFTLYTFAPDTSTKSNCGAGCTDEWPPLLVPKGSKLSSLVHGVPASRLGKVKRSNGKFQLTYDGKPLYRFAGDKSVGQTNGQGFANLWSVALVLPAVTTTAPTAAPVITPAPQSPSTGSGTSGGSPQGSSPTSPPPTSPPPTSPPPTSPPPTSPPTTQPPYNGGGGGGGGYGY